MGTQTAAPDNNIIVRLRNVRLSFPVLFTPKADDKGKLKYGAAFLMPLGHPGIKDIEDTIAVIIKAKNKGVKLPYGKVCLRNGEDKEFDGYGEGIKFTSTSSKNAPLVCDLNRRTIGEKDANAPYAGCYVNANINLWWQDDKEFGKRVNASLESIQFLRHGEPFGAGPKDADTEFGDVDVDTTVGGDDDLN